MIALCSFVLLSLFFGGVVFYWVDAARESKHKINTLTHFDDVLNFAWNTAVMSSTKLLKPAIKLKQQLIFRIKRSKYSPFLQREASTTNRTSFH